MSEKKWSLKDNTDKVELLYSRRMMNNYEGTHLGMSRRWTHKSGPMSTSWTKNYKKIGEVPRKYIIGLLNKFIGKSYNDFVNEYSHKLSSFEGVNKDDYLKYIAQSKIENDIFHKKFSHNSGCDFRDRHIYQPYGGYRPYYVDDNGIIQKAKLDDTCTNKKGFNKIQLTYNSRLYIPKFKDVKIYNNSNYRNDYILKQEFKQPLYFFDAFIKIENKIVKLPLYGCIEPIFIDYNLYCNHHKNGKGFYKRGTFHLTLFTHSEPQAQNIENEWVGISWQDIPKVKHEQHYHVYCENSKYNEIKNKIDICEAKGEDTTQLRRKLNNTPKLIYQDLGFGNEIRYFIKRSDYEKTIKNKTS